MHVGCCRCGVCVVGRLAKVVDIRRDVRLAAIRTCRNADPRYLCRASLAVQRVETFGVFCVAAFAALSRFSKSAIEMAPGTRSPSSKKIVGVPLIFLSRP